MKTFLLDTNVIIRFLNGRAPLIRQRLAQVPFKSIKVSAITKAELFFGALRSQRAQQNLSQQQQFLANFDSLPFDDLAAEHYADIRAQLTLTGQMIGPNDLLIAAIARSRHLTLVSANYREFERVEKLKLENWEEA